MAKESRINEQIHVPRVRLVGADGEQFGIMPMAEALQKARGLDLDLVEVAPNADPPVCRIMDYGKYKYIQSKREQEARKKQTVIQVKEIKVRPKTDDHDMNVKIRHIRRFLEEGDKVKVTVRFRGRELSYASQSGFEILKNIVAAVSDISKVEIPPRMEGRTMTAIVSPTAPKKKTAGQQAGPPGAPGRRAPEGAGAGPPGPGGGDERAAQRPSDNQEGRNA